MLRGGVSAEAVESAQKLPLTSTPGRANDCTGASLAEAMKTNKGLRTNQGSCGLMYAIMCMVN